mmetsp:Transcript_547/g.1667  ORF Transcript_547/g.1667 Transcript_547/m.1667 type:complete len:553 (-) Transcript_547:68-1726(-)
MEHQELEDDQQSTATESQQSTVTIDEAFQSSIGEFGRGQQLLYCVAQLAWFPSAMQTLVMVFVGIDPITQRWFSCNEGSGYEACTSILNSSDPVTWAEFCSLPEGSYTWTRRKDSIISEWDLICEDAWKQQVVNSVFFAGFMIGAGLLGSLSDTSGRKVALLVSLAVAGVSGVLCGLAPSYWVYCLTRFTTGLGVAGMGLVAYVLGCEYVGPSWRGFLGVSAQYFFAAGLVAMSLVAFGLPNWRGLCFISGGAAIIYTLVLPILPESPRWHLISGMKQEATATLTRIASYNGTSTPSASLRDMVEVGQPREGLREVFTHRVLLWRLLVQMYVWFAISSMYYGIALMCADLPGSVYVNNIILSLVEVVAYLAASLLLDRLGRRWTIAGSYLLGGCCLLLSAFFSGTVRLVLAFVAKLGAAAAFASIFIFAAELFPTVIRNSCMGVMSQAARVGGILTPAIILAGHELNFPMLGFLVLGITNVTAGLLLLTQPETLDTELPESIMDVDRSKPPSLSGSEGGLEDVLPHRRKTWGLGFSRLRFTRLVEQDDGRSI